MKTGLANNEGIKRIDGRLKVTGYIKYAAEYHLPGLLYGALVSSTIAKGTITAIDSKAAEKAPGVVKVLTYLNGLNISDERGSTSVSKNQIKTFADDKIYFSGQPIVLVIANTFELQNTLLL